MEKFLKTYQNLTAKNFNSLAEIYTEDVCFIDPAHKICGLEKLTEYFVNLYQNIDPPIFRFVHQLRSKLDGYVQWEMDFSHPRLKAGRLITVPGASYLRFEDSDKVFFHRDYFDLGAMLYEHIPLVARMITAVKRRLGS
jgi:hypothetical protein